MKITLVDTLCLHVFLTRDYDERIVSYDRLLDVFWNNHDPTTLNQQGPDIGTQYRSVIFYSSSMQKNIAEKSLKDIQNNFNRKIVTEILNAKEFYRAEEYHQNYLIKNNYGNCSI